MCQKVAVLFCHMFHVRGACSEVTVFIKTHSYLKQSKLGQMRQRAHGIR